MNEIDVRELFIRAAEIEQKLPANERPARLKSQSLPFVHTDEDMRGWGTERLSSNRVEALTRMSAKIQASDVSEWERAISLISLVTRSRNRRCLWAYAQSKAGTLAIPQSVKSVINMQENYKQKVRPIVIGDTVLKRVSFSKWCRDVEHVHRNYGKVCADNAIAEIVMGLARKTLSHNETGMNGTLQHGREIRDIRANLEERGPIEYRLFCHEKGAWPVRDEAKALLRFDEEIMHFDIEEARKRDRRRQREARKREAA